MLCCPIYSKENIIVRLKYIKAIDLAQGKKKHLADKNQGVVGGCKIRVVIAEADVLFSMQCVCL